MKTTLTVDENGILTFPDELIKETGWEEGDVLEWIPTVSYTHLTLPTNREV